jgi:sterol desaturase/sphingolipid hydroxylase (fatty acid hydroxylase superfamily)
MKTPYPFRTAIHHDVPKKQMFTGLVKWTFYPLALSCTLLYIYFETHGKFGTLGATYPIYLALIIGVMLLLEWFIPLRKEWSMTWFTFSRRDVPMLIINGIAIALTTRGITELVKWHNGGSVADVHLLSWWGEAMLALLLSDFMWYWIHRYSHEGKSLLGTWLWRTHVIHHLPQQVYVFMHIAGHPINGIYVRVILMLPAILFGFSKEAIFAAAVINGFQGLMSHFNVNIRAGWFNYFFMGTELHRYHHSADPKEGKNYAAVVTIWDQLFGTFQYRPQSPPNKLGVYNRDAYPLDEEWLKLMNLPFSKN